MSIYKKSTISTRLQSVKGGSVIYSKNSELHIKRFVSKLLANISLQKKLHSEMKSSEMPGFERVPNRVLNKLFPLMNPESILVLEN